MVSIKTKRKLIKLVKEKTGVNFRYCFANLDYSAHVLPKEAIVTFAKVKKQKWQRDTMEEFIGDILHEVVHIMCYRDGIFMSYHRDPITKAQKRAYLRTAWIAEKWVDRRAKKMARELFGIGYRLLYKTPSDKKWLEDNMLEPLRIEWGFKNEKINSRKS